MKKMILTSVFLGIASLPSMATEGTLEAFSQTTTQETVTQVTEPQSAEHTQTTTPETDSTVSTEKYKETAEYQKDGSSTQAKYEYDKTVDQNHNETKVTTQESVIIKDEQN